MTLYFQYEIKQVDTNVSEYYDNRLEAKTRFNELRNTGIYVQIYGLPWSTEPELIKSHNPNEITKEEMMEMVEDAFQDFRENADCKDLVRIANILLPQEFILIENDKYQTVS